MGRQLRVDQREHFGGHLLAPLDRVAPVHQDLRLHDGDEPRFLAQRGVSGQRVGVGLDAVPRRIPSPMSITARHFAKRRPAPDIPAGVPQTVETLGDLLPGNPNNDFAPRRP